jgi:hypothetical protein
VAQPSGAGPAHSAPPSLRWAFGVVGLLFVGALALVLVAINRPEPPSYPPTPAGAPAPPDASGTHMATIDASSPDHWVFFSFSEGVLAGRRARLDWDLAFRRFHIIPNGGPGFAGRGGIRDLGPVPFASVTAAPAGAFTANTLSGRDSVNSAIARWYRYGFTSHLLTPLGHVYAVRAADGSTVKLEILGYYCPRALPGCVTVRWAPLAGGVGPGAI